METQTASDEEAKAPATEESKEDSGYKNYAFVELYSEDEATSKSHTIEFRTQTELNKELQHWIEQGWVVDFKKMVRGRELKFKLDTVVRLQ